MHIPDGMLSPATSLTAAVVMLPVWTLAARRVRAALGTRQVPLLSLGAAFCFTVMMFNIPALGGTTAHPVAGTLLAILLGPYAACIGISVALAIQALFFGDGGLLAWGANCFTMAFALPFVGYSVYRALSARMSPDSPRRALAGGVGAYIGLNVAAALVAVLLGVQPALFHEANGHALYFPFGLNITLPAMLSTHLLVAGPVEAVVTFLAIRYMQTTGQTLYEEGQNGRRGNTNSASAQAANHEPGVRPAVRPGRTRTTNHEPRTLGIGLLALVALTPLGLLAKGEAWGEWDAAGVQEQIKRVEGREYVPQGIAQADKQAYKGVGGLRDYASNDGKNKFGYAGAGLLGVATISGLLLLGGRLLTANSRKEDSRREDSREEERADRDRNNDGEPPTSSGTGAGLSAKPSHTTDEPITNAAVPANDDANAPGSDLPEWLRGSASHDIPFDLTGSRPNPYVERTLSGLAHNALVTLQSERWARQAGYLQRLDPRAKVFAFALLILTTASVHRLAALLGLYAFALLLGIISSLPLGLLLRRVWLSVAFFAGALALPATLNAVTPGHALLTLWAHPYMSPSPGPACCSRSR